MATHLDSPNFSLASFGTSTSAGGWTSENQYPRELADVNGDGRADIVGFGSNGAYVSLAQANGTFAGPTLASTSFGTAGGWASQNEVPRELADVNGDGRADIVGFGHDGVFVALAQANGTFAQPTFELSAFGSSIRAGGWTSQNEFPRELADVNGDGHADIVGFGSNGVYVSLAQANGTFAGPTLASTSFGSTGGWTSENQYPRELADMNGDGRADIVGFGSGGVYVALAQANGTFASPTFELGTFGASTSAGGWTSENQYPRAVADVNGDGHGDIVGFGAAGTYVSLWHPDVMA